MSAGVGIIDRFNKPAINLTASGEVLNISFNDRNRNRRPS
jgi:hypothetical protein